MNEIFPFKLIKGTDNKICSQRRIKGSRIKNKLSLGIKLPSIKLSRK